MKPTGAQLHSGSVCGYTCGLDVVCPPRRIHIWKVWSLEVVLGRGVEGSLMGNQPLRLLRCGC